ncbi:MAG TPA: hypothetical protein ENN68_08540 [Methanomicrobia archaeon]|nr:hypothetical protein [Methanomicrobia archaeon]
MVKFNYRLIVSLVLVSLLCATSFSVIGWAADETPFMKVTPTDMRFDDVGGPELVNGGSEVSIKLVMTNVSKEFERSTLTFHSELENAVGSISGEGLVEQALKSGSSYTLEHKKLTGDVVVTWSGGAPDVGKRESFVFLDITQKTSEGTYTVSHIIKDVSSQTIEDAIAAFDTASKAIAKANTAIADAEQRGLDVREAETRRDLANEYLSNAQRFYGEGRAEDALEEAEKAVKTAHEAEAKAGAAVSGRAYLNYGVIAAVIIVAAVVFVLLLQQRNRRRGVY